MKTLLLSSLFSVSAFASGLTSVNVVSADFGVPDYSQRKSLCVTVVEVPSSGKLLGLVEDISDCFYTREAKHSATLDLNLNEFKPVTEPVMNQHLQTLDRDVTFYFSDAE